MAPLRWLKQLLRHWILEVTGGVLIGALALASNVEGLPLPAQLYEVVIGLVLLYAAFLTWREEEQRRIEAERHAREAEANCPTLRGEGEWQVVEQPKNWPILVVNARVINVGAQTVVDGWELTVQLAYKNGRRRSLNLPAAFRSTPAKRANKPLRKGEILQGQLRWLLSDEAFDFGEAVEGVEIAFSDFLKQRYVVTCARG